MTQEKLLAQYRSADLFALASRIARDGDRDGLPNVLMEAQSQGLACVASRLPAIAELVRDEIGRRRRIDAGAEPVGDAAVQHARQPAGTRLADESTTHRRVA